MASYFLQLVIVLVTRYDRILWWVQSTIINAAQFQNGSATRNDDDKRSEVLIVVGIIIPIVTHRASHDKIYGPSTVCVLTLAAAANVRFCVTLHVRIACYKQKKRGGNDDETVQERNGNSHGEFAVGVEDREMAGAMSTN